MTRICTSQHLVSYRGPSPGSRCELSRAKLGMHNRIVCLAESLHSLKKVRGLSPKVEPKENDTSLRIIAVNTTESSKNALFSISCICNCLNLS